MEDIKELRCMAFRFALEGRKNTPVSVEKVVKEAEVIYAFLEPGENKQLKNDNSKT